MSYRRYPPRLEWTRDDWLFACLLVALVVIVVVFYIITE